MQKELQNEYEQYVGKNLRNFAIKSIPNIRGTISKQFENFTDPYVERESKDLHEAIFKELDSDLSKKAKYTSNIDEHHILGSSIVMFK